MEGDLRDLMGWGGVWGLLVIWLRRVKLSWLRGRTEVLLKGGVGPQLVGAVRCLFFRLYGDSVNTGELVTFTDWVSVNRGVRRTAPASMIFDCSKAILEVMKR